jgi:hypothetical protein
MGRANETKQHEPLTSSRSAALLAGRGDCRGAKAMAPERNVERANEVNSIIVVQGSPIRADTKRLLKQK